MKYIFFLLFATILFADTQNKPNPTPWIFNQTEEPNIENSFQETKYFHTSDPEAATGVFILNGLIHHDKITDSLTNQEKNEKLLYQFDEHKKFK
jgi:hypothetical protein